MTEPETPDIDRRLREAFEDDAAAAARIAREALADEDAHPGRSTPDTLTARMPRGRNGWAAVAAGAAVVLIASALVFWPDRRLPEPAAEPSEPLVLSGVITDGALIVQLPDGSTSISWGGARDDRPPDGSGIVIVEGVAK
jgi:hypothetical protein